VSFTKAAEKSWLCGSVQNPDQGLLQTARQAPGVHHYPSRFQIPFTIGARTFLSDKNVDKMSRAFQLLAIIAVHILSGRANEPVSRALWLGNGEYERNDREQLERRADILSTFLSDRNVRAPM